MRHCGACDGRFTSREHQYRTWLALNSVFGDTEPPEPPEPPVPPVTGGNVVWLSNFGSEVRTILSQEQVVERLRYMEYTPAGSSEQILLPMFCLSGKREVIVLFTEIRDSAEPLTGWICRYGRYLSNGEYVGEYSHELGPLGEINHELLVEVFFCDGEQYV